MSGGSMNYLYSKVLHCADFSLDTPEREAFAKHLKLVAQALHDIEWVDSGDYGPGNENAAIRACLNPAPPQRKPLTDQEIDRIRADCVLTPHEYRDRAYGWALHFARAVERAHGIVGQSEDENPSFG